MPLPSLPPAFHLVALDREVAAFERAVRAAPRGVDDGTVYWTDRADRLELAVVLEPEAPAARTLEAVHVLTVAAGDALGTLLPPQVPVAFAWPADLILDGAKLGQVQAALAPVAGGADAVPPWLVLGLNLSVGPLGPDPGLFPDRTSLHGEGAGDITSAQLVEGVTRHLLHWTSRWLEEGLAPVRGAWNARCFRRGERSEIVLAGRRVSGEVKGLDAGGAFVLGDHRFELSESMIGLR
jgi:BirA family transcriptional regulator, biotin operon repressor / biotin---[acetyl-CoA-carboxylase] ligase